jgi:hypothetical protein
MTAPSLRLRLVIDNMAIAILCAALATGAPADWLWWPVNADWFLWMTCALSASIVVIGGLRMVIERQPLIEEN